jgi:hypothetical protein
MAASVPGGFPVRGQECVAARLGGMLRYTSTLSDATSTCFLDVFQREYNNLSANPSLRHGQRGVTLQTLSSRGLELPT